jgi:peptidyl-Lys metalloendopeptidase
MSINRNFKWLAGGIVGMSLLAGGCGLPEESGAQVASETPVVAGDLRVSLSVGRTAFRASEEVAVTVTLTNVGTQEARLLKWYLPGSQDVEEVFQVLRDGEEVEYIGPHYKRPAPTAGEYLTLAPGESFSGSVTLSGMYDLSESGSYTLRYAPAPDHAHGVRLQRVGQLLSDDLTLWIDGRPSGHPEVEAQGTVTAAALSTANCTSTQASSISSAFTSAKSYADNSYSYLVNTTPGNTARYKTWFGSYTSTGWTTAKNHFYSIRDALYNKSVVVDCNCTSSAYAYVYKNSPYRIYVCNAFWSAPSTGTDSKAGTLVHELSHFSVVADTDDHAYGQTNCKNLAVSNPSLSLDNADSHEYFAENTPFLN